MIACRVAQSEKDCKSATSSTITTRLRPANFPSLGRGTKAPKSQINHWRSNEVNRRDTRRKSSALSNCDVTARAGSKVGAVDESQKKMIRQGRFFIRLAALLYSSLNVSTRFIYAAPDIPPTAAALSATKAWLAFFCLP